MMNFDFASVAAALTDLDHNGVKFVGKAAKWGTEAEAKDLIDAIDACKNLQFLNLEGNTLGVEAAKGIGKALAKHPELQQALWKDLFTGRMKEEIPIALKALGAGMIAAGAKLTVLDCSDNALGPNGMVGLVDLLKSPTCYTLQELKLNNCGLGTEGGRMLAKALLECHAASSQNGTPLALKVFIAGRNRLENIATKALSEMFATVGTLEHIEMPQNGIYHPGITALSEAFKQNPNLRILNLNDNTIGPKGAAAIADAVVEMECLREINFGDCLLKTKGAMLLAEALQDAHVDIEVLDFGFNEIGPEGGYSLVHATCNKEKLKSLILNGNMFGEECRDQIHRLLEEYGREKTLGPLDEDVEEDEEDEEDEGEETEEDDEDDDEEDVEDEDDEEDGDGEQEDTEQTLLECMKQQSERVNGGTANVSIDLDSTLPNTVESYCQVPYPSETMFKSLEEPDKIAAFREYLKAIPSEDYLVHVAFTILKCSEIAENCSDALVVSEALYRDAFEYAKNNNRLNSLRNFLLINLGLLKCEDKKFKPQYNVQGCRFALRHALQQKIIPQEDENMFQLLLENAGIGGGAV